LSASTFRRVGWRRAAESAVMPVVATAGGADQLAADTTDARGCRRMAADARQAARPARKRAQAMIVDNDARRARMRKVWAGLNGSAPAAG
jgi:hypothetical protein